MSTKLFITNILKRRQQMSNEEKLEEIKRLCSSIMETWGQKSSYNEPFYDRPYEDGQVMGRSTLAETILEIINNG